MPVAVAPEGPAELKSRASRTPPRLAWGEPDEPGQGPVRSGYRALDSKALSAWRPASQTAQLPPRPLQPPPHIGAYWAALDKAYQAVADGAPDAPSEYLSYRRAFGVQQAVTAFVQQQQGEATPHGPLMTATAHWLASAVSGLEGEQFPVADFARVFASTLGGREMGPSSLDAFLEHLAPVDRPGPRGGAQWPIITGLLKETTGCWPDLYQPGAGHAWLYQHSQILARRSLGLPALAACLAMIRVDWQFEGEKSEEERPADFLGQAIQTRVPQASASALREGAAAIVWALANLGRRDQALTTCLHALHPLVRGACLRPESYLPGAVLRGALDELVTIVLTQGYFPVWAASVVDRFQSRTKGMTNLQRSILGASMDVPLARLQTVSGEDKAASPSLRAFIRDCESLRAACMTPSLASPPSQVLSVAPGSARGEDPLLQIVRRCATEARYDADAHLDALEGLEGVDPVTAVCDLMPWMGPDIGPAQWARIRTKVLRRHQSRHAVGEPDGLADEQPGLPAGAAPADAWSRAALRAAAGDMVRVVTAYGRAIGLYLSDAQRADMHKGHANKAREDAVLASEYRFWSEAIRTEAPLSPGLAARPAGAPQSLQAWAGPVLSRVQALRGALAGWR